MKVLVVTGRHAEKLVRESATGADVLILDADIAAFITPAMLIQAAPRSYELILIPGAITSDFSRTERVLDTKIRLGPKHAADLGFVLKHLDEIELSTSIPACVLLEEKRLNDARAILAKLEADAKPRFCLKDLKIGGTSRMKVLAEIVDATRFSPDELARKTNYYEKAGADMIDLGLPMDALSEDVSSTVETARKVTDLPLSIDAIRPDLIHAAIKSGANMVLSLNGENIPSVGPAVAEKGLPSVVIPGPGSMSLEENVRTAQDLGIQVIADPVLDPPLLGLAKSLSRYTSFRERFPDIPLFFGVGNVTELLDADTQGSNALLAAIAAEVGASILFTPEFSPKARGSVRELRTASEMMFLASNRKSPPKDLGFDLLVLKEKRDRPQDMIDEPYIEAKAHHAYIIDPAGNFRIIVANGKIWAKHDKHNIAGTNAKDVLNTIIDLGLVSSLDHVGYLGRELQKAELALRLERSYTQDEALLSEKS
jgi:dihydropteroate synthase-like protein